MLEVMPPAFVRLEIRRAVVGDNLEDEQPACLSLVLGWLKGGQIEGQQAMDVRSLLPLIST